MNKTKAKEKEIVVSQDEIDDLMAIADFIDGKKSTDEHSLIEEMKSAILDSGKLTLKEWHTLRRRLHEIEDIIPHIDLIIRLKEQRNRIEKMSTQY